MAHPQSSAEPACDRRRPHFSPDIHHELNKRCTMHDKTICNFKAAARVSNGKQVAVQAERRKRREADTKD